MTYDPAASVDLNFDIFGGLMGWFKMFGSVEVETEVEKVEEKPKLKGNGADLYWDRDAECWKDQQDGTYADPTDYLARGFQNKSLLQFEYEQMDMRTSCLKATFRFEDGLLKIDATYAYLFLSTADLIAYADWKTSQRKAESR